MILCKWTLGPCYSPHKNCLDSLKLFITEKLWHICFTRTDTHKIMGVIGYLLGFAHGELLIPFPTHALPGTLIFHELWLRWTHLRGLEMTVFMGVSFISIRDNTEEKQLNKEEAASQTSRDWLGGIRFGAVMSCFLKVCWHLLLEERQQWKADARWEESLPYFQFTVNCVENNRRDEVNFICLFLILCLY